MAYVKRNRWGHTTIHDPLDVPPCPACGKRISMYGNGKRLRHKCASVCTLCGTMLGFRGEWADDHKCVPRGGRIVGR